MNILIKTLSFALALNLAACAMGPTVSIARISKEKYQPSSANEVALITSGKIINKPYTEIGFINAEEGPGTQSYEQIISVVQSKAAEMGADAVIISTGSQIQGALPVGGMLMAVSGKHVKAIAIKWEKQP